MVRQIRIIQKGLFTGEHCLAWIRNTNDFIIPTKGDVINLNEEQIGEWNGEASCKDWEVRYVKYEYLHKPIFDGENDVCVITIYVK